MRSHPGEGELRALLDGALERAGGVRLRWHLLRCHACRARLEEARQIGGRVAALLAHVSVEADMDEAWQRVAARNGARAPRRLSTAFSFLGGGVAGAAAFALALLFLNGSGFAPKQAPANAAAFTLHDHCCSDQDGDGIAEEGLLMLSDGTRRRLTLSYRDLDGSGSLSEGDVVRAVLAAPEP